MTSSSNKLISKSTSNNIKSVVDLLHWRAFHQPDQGAYTFLIDGEEEVNITYGELDVHAKTIGALLQSYGLSGERVLLLYPPGLEYISAFFGCLYAGAVAVPAYPPRRNKSLSKIEAIVADADAAMALTTTATLSDLERLFMGSSELSRLRYLTTDSPSTKTANDWKRPRVNGNKLAFLQYTSGSTATPKGVMLTHGNLLQNSEIIFRKLGTSSELRAVSWLPPYHDMGLIGFIVQGMYSGEPVILMSPVSFLQRPIRWLQAISHYKATHSGGPNFAFELCTRVITSEQKSNLDLTSWKVAFTGAEPIRHKTLERFTEAFEPCGFRLEAFYPCYGLAESTLFVTGGEKKAPPVVRSFDKVALQKNQVVEWQDDEENSRTLVGCGHAPHQNGLRIVDPGSQIQCPPDRVGEIWVSGASIAKGYWNKPKETEDSFHACTADTDEGPFLRTGDLGFLKDGELFVTGRLKDLIIIRGANHYPDDIELTVEKCHPALQPGCGAAFSLEMDDEERLIVVQEIKRKYRNSNLEEIFGAIRQAVAEQHDLQVFSILLLNSGSVPKTSSGKIQRHACRDGFLARTLKVAGEWSHDYKDDMKATRYDHFYPEEGTDSTNKSKDREAIKKWLASRISERLSVNPEEIDASLPFTRYGLDSKEAIIIASEMEDWLGRQLSPALVYEYPTIDALSRFLAGEHIGSPSPRPASRQEKHEPQGIAIIGIGCRFPKAKNPEDFWKLLTDGADAITEVPISRWDVDEFFDPNPDIPGKMYTRWGGFIEDVDKFDAEFFGIAPREAVNMDPQQRLLLEVSWEALENASQAPDKLVGSRTGVFIGISTNDYLRLQLKNNAVTDINAYSGTGTADCITSGRLSYILGLQGPNLTIDTACSSSLVAVHLACQSLRNGESDMALAGGVNLILSPDSTIYFCKLRALSADGRCKTFDASADGYVRGEGCGIVVLKRLSDALKNGDNVLAVIRGSAINHDGLSSGLTVPSGLAQQRVIRDALTNADIEEQSQISYVEAHGTGTSLGDPIEIRAIGEALANERTEDDPLAVGSVKTNIGHLEAAAGIAGLIKVVLALQNKEIPPHLNLTELNPHISREKLPIVIQTRRTPWSSKMERRIAGISSFGFSGTNAHVVVEEAPEMASDHPESAEEDKRPYLLTLSGHTPEVLEEIVRSHQKFISSQGDRAYPSLRDICYTASVRRKHHDNRISIVAHSKEELVDYLEAFLEGEHLNGLSFGQASGADHKLVFVFSPTGSQWVGMGLELFQNEPVFRETIKQCDQLFKRWVDWSLIEELNANDDESRLREVDVMQPVLCAIQVALSALWRSWGIEPDAVVGHSMGEISAAHTAGILTLEDAVMAICRRSQLVKQKAAGRGAMAVVELSHKEVSEIISSEFQNVSIAACNGPTTTVVSGDLEILQKLHTTLDRTGTFCQMVKVDYASHSPQMDIIRADLLEALDGLRPNEAKIRMVSTVTSSPIHGSECNSSYWMDNLRNTVSFYQAVDNLISEGYHTFLEISPHPILSVSITQSLDHRDIKGLVLPSLRRNEEERGNMLSALGKLYTVGYPIDWSKQYSNSGRTVHLPSHIWQKERFWIEGKHREDGRILGSSTFSRNKSGTRNHPLLGQHLELAAQSDTHVWEKELDLDLLPYLADHRLEGMAVFPAAAYVEMALAAAAQAFGPACHVLEAFSFKNALFISENVSQRIQSVLSITMPGQASFQVYSIQKKSNDEQLSSWVLNATGTIHIENAEISSSPPDYESIATIRARCKNTITSSQHYTNLQQWGIQYGSNFQGVEEIWGRKGEAVAKIKLPELLMSKLDRYQIHPVLLDSCLQVFLETQSSDSEPITYLPVGLERLSVHMLPKPNEEYWSHAIQKKMSEPNGDRLSGDLILLDMNGNIMMEAKGIKCQRLQHIAKETLPQNLEDWFYEIQWRKKQPQKKEILSKPHPQNSQGSWLIFCDANGIGNRLADKLVGTGEKCFLVFPGHAFGRTTKKDNREHFHINPSKIKDFKKLLNNILRDENLPCRGVVHMWSLDPPSPEKHMLDSIESSKQIGCFTLLRLAQNLVKIHPNKPPKLWIITSGTQSVGEKIGTLSIAQSPTWGLGKVIAAEHPELKCTNIDLSISPKENEIQCLFHELFADDNENQIVLSHESRYVARLARYTNGSKGEKTVLRSANLPFQLEITTPGILDNFILRETKSKKPGPGEVEIKVKAAGLNFRDVMTAMELLPPIFEGSAGWECSGTISAIGKGVKGFKVGDEVIAFGSRCFSSHVITYQYLTAHKPDHISFEEASTIPLAFMTAYYSLRYMARLKKGERVLIHSAAGGVGQAAVQISKLFGAEVFATAGSPEKREFLKSQGIEHVMDSRSLEFADQVMKITKGRGVDVILNSLAGEYITKGLSILGPGGRFLEIGKLDFTKNTQLGLKLLENNISFISIDLSEIFADKDRARLYAVFFQDLIKYFENAQLIPLPFTLFPISDAVSAFRYLAQAKNIGKVVISLNEKEVVVEPASKNSSKLRLDGSYLITGGLGGIGLIVAQWLVDNGARHLVLMGRRGAASSQAREAVKRMKKCGAQIDIAKVDVAQENQVAKLIRKIKRTMPPLKGIIHAAAVSDDGILLQLNEDRFQTAMAPKINGAWHLHNLTLDCLLDFFVLFSSAASVLGFPGLGTYVSANTFLDVFSYYRKSLGLPSLTINWGLWGNVGLAAETDRIKRFMDHGIIPFSSKQAVELLERAMQLNQSNVMPIHIDWNKFVNLFCSAEIPPLLSMIAEEIKIDSRQKSRREKDGLIRERILLAEPEKRNEILQSYIQENVSIVLGVPPSRLGLRKSLMNLGLDSLMALELKNRVEANLLLELPVARLLKGPSISELANDLLEIMMATCSEGPVDKITRTLEEVEQMPDEVAKALLEEKESTIGAHIKHSA